MPLAPGAKLGPYVVEAAAGSGGKGEARDTRLDRTAAIKVLPAPLAADPRFRERFEREARTVSRLDDPEERLTTSDNDEYVGAHQINVLIGWTDDVERRVAAR